MTRIIVNRVIEAPVDVVFCAVSDIANLPETVSNIVGVEFLSDTRSGLGTRFRETRMMQGKESITELEITEFAENDHLRMVADSHGTIWDTLFEVEPAGDTTTLRLTMDAHAQRLLPRITNPLVKGMIRKGLERHVDEVKAYCER